MSFAMFLGQFMQYIKLMLKSIHSFLQLFLLFFIGGGRGFLFSLEILRASKQDLGHRVKVVLSGHKR